MKMIGTSLFDRPRIEREPHLGRGGRGADDKAVFLQRARGEHTQCRIVFDEQDNGRSHHARPNREPVVRST